MPTPTLRSELRWSSLDLPHEPATGSVPLRWAEVGERGPLAVVTCGVHGDEGPWGALAVQRVLDRPLADLTGRLRVVLAANPTAVAADRRGSPLDHLDLNRYFPGSADGSHTERLGAALTGVVEGADVLVDLHGGGSWCVNAFTFRFPGSEALADAIGAPFVVDMPLRSGHLAGMAAERGAKVVAVEMGGRSVDELAWRDRLADGVDRVLAHAGVLSPRLPDPEPARRVEGLTVLRPSRGGVYVPTLRQDAIGTVVPEGTELGVLRDLGTMEPVETFKAPFPETALMLLRPHVTVLEGGAMTFVVGRPA